MNSHIEYIATNISGTIEVLCRIHLFACQSVLKIYNYHNSLINSHRHYIGKKLSHKTRQIIQTPEEGIFPKT